MEAPKALQTARSLLKGKSANPLRDAELILSSVLKIPPLKVHLNRRLNGTEAGNFFRKVKQREEGRPLDYILKQKFFCNRPFFVSEGVFIPRPGK